MNANSNTIENNNPAICEGCGAEYNGRYDDRWCEGCRFVDCKMCGECVHRDDVCPHGIDGGCNCECVCEECWHECGICYNLSASRPSQGFYCDHRVCGDCSNQITTCPFCRRPWDEEEEEDLICRGCITGHSTHWRRFWDTETERMVWWCNECWGDGEYNEGVVVLEERHNPEQTLYQVRANDNQDLQYDNEGEWQFTTEEHAREIYSNVMDDIAEGVLEEIYNLRITRTPGIVTIEEWVRPQ